MEDVPTFLEGGGRCGALIARRDWSDSALGPIDGWPASLRTATAILLRSPTPMVMLWGEEGVMIYNDAYSAFAGGRHPQLLGSRVREGWPEVADFNDNVMRVGLAGGTLAYRDMELTLHRHGAPEQVFMNLDYSPVPGDDGRPAGVLAVVVETTEAVQARRALQASEARLRGVLDGMDEAFGLMDSEFRILSQNREALSLDPRPPHEILGRSHWEVYPGSEGSELGQLYKRAMAEQAPVALEHRYTFPDGTDRWLDMRAHPVPEGLAVFWRDITERKAAEAARAESEERFRVLVSTIEDVFYVTDLTTITLEYLSPSFEAIWGRPAQALHDDPTSFLDTLHPDDRRSFVEGRAAQLRGEQVTLEYRIFRPDGEMRWILDRSFPVPGRERTRAAGIASDITARKLAEAALRDSEAKLRAVLDAVPVGLVFADASGRITGGNARVQEILGHPVLPSAGVHEYGQWVSFHPDGRQVAGEEYPLARALAGEERPELETLYQRGDGRRSWVHFIASAVRDGQDALLGGVVASLDVDGERRAEAELRRLNDRLAQEVERAVAERAEAQARLHEAQKLETIGQLTGGVAHDFNNLLTPIVGALDIVRRRVADPRSERLLAGALQSAERAATLVSRLLAFARRQTLQPRAIGPAELVEGMRELIDRSLGPTIEVCIDVPADLPAILVDPNQLELALLNLSVNARDAMPDGGRLSISAEPREVPPGAALGLASGPYIRLAVTDTGVGMDEATLRRAVEPFFSTKGTGKGTGLGLSMVHGLAAQSGGFFDLQSRPGEGTTAALWLPATALVPRGEERTSDGPAPRAPRRSLVLLVDDEHIVRLSTAEGLRDLGYEVAEAATAAEAIEAVRRGLAPDVVVTDHMMPGMTGAQLAAELRASRPDLPLLMITGYANLPPEQTRGLQVLAKPFRQADLATLLAGMLAERVADAPAGKG